MNPLQKKCIIATAGFHLLLLVILFLGPGFFRQPSPPDALPVLKVIPLNAIEAALTSGSAAVTPPPAAHQQPPQPPQPVTPTPPTPEPPKPVATPPVEPKPVEAKPVEHEVEPTPEVAKPEPDVEKPSAEPAPLPKPEHTIDIDLTHVVHKVSKTRRHEESEAREAAAEARAEARAEHEAEQQREQAISRITGSIRNNLTHDTDVTMPGESSAATANYGQIVKSIYYNAWNLPDSASSDEASPKVRIVVARDGSVISAHIIEPSGDAAVDDSVQRTLDRVTFIRPFAEDATENERTFTIKFDAQTKRSE
jgi:TonB family protein